MLSHHRKGFTKAVSRLPHTISTKTGIRDGTTQQLNFLFFYFDTTSKARRRSEINHHTWYHTHILFSFLFAQIETRDDEFAELNGKFTTCERITANLLQEVMKYRDNVTCKCYLHTFHAIEA